MAYIDQPTRRPRLRGYSSLEILLALAWDAEHRRGWRRANRLKRNASFYEMTKAIERTRNAKTRAQLCYLVGKKCHFSHQQHIKVVLPLPKLIKCLNDESANVRSEAADALGCTHNPLAGPPLMQQFGIEQDDGVRRMIAAVLGAVQYRPAIPLLMQLITGSDASMRGSAAWSLGKLHAHEAAAALREAWYAETEDYPKENMARAFQEIEGSPVWSKRHS